jgi:hypothetical protein
MMHRGGRGGLATIFTANKAWERGLRKKYDKSHVAEAPKSQFYNLMGGKIYKSLFGNVVPFATNVAHLAYDLVHNAAWSGLPLGLAESFGDKEEPSQDVFFNFAEIDWNIAEGRSPLSVQEIRKCTAAFAATLRRYTEKMPADVSIVVCSTLDDHGNVVPYQQDYLKCTGCKSGRVENVGGGDRFVCSYCRSEWTRLDNVRDDDQDGADADHDCSGGGDRDSDSSDVDFGNAMELSKACFADAGAAAAAAASAVDVNAQAQDARRPQGMRRRRDQFQLTSAGRLSASPHPRVVRKKSDKNGIHLRCRNFPVNQAVAESLRRCFIYTLMTTFPDEPTDSWSDRIDPAPLTGRSLRAMGQFKKANCHRCNGKGKIPTAGGAVECTACPLSRGIVAVDKRYLVGDELVLQENPADDYWLSDRAEEEQVRRAAAAHGGDPCGGAAAPAPPQMPAAERMARFRNAGNTEANWRFILTETSVSNVPAGTRPVELDLAQLRRVPKDDSAVSTLRRNHRGKTTEYRMWDTLIGQRNRGRRRKGPQWGDADRHKMQAVHGMIRRMFPFPKLPNGCFDVDVREHAHPQRGPALQRDFLVRRDRDLAAMADLPSDDLDPSPYDECTVGAVVFTGPRKDGCFVSLVGTGNKWCPQKHREKVQDPRRVPTSDHNSCPVYFYVNRVSRTVQCRCHSARHVCARCVAARATDCTHGWWSERPMDKQVMTPAEMRVFFGREGSGEGRQEHAEAADVGKLADTYSFLKTGWGGGPEAVRRHILRHTHQLVTESQVLNSICENADITGNKMHYTMHYFLTAQQSMAQSVQEEAREWAAEHPEAARQGRKRMRAFVRGLRGRPRPDDMGAAARRGLGGARAAPTYDSAIQDRKDDLEKAIQDAMDDAGSNGDDDGNNSDAGDGDGGVAKRARRAKRPPKLTEHQAARKRKHLIGSLRGNGTTTLVVDPTHPRTAKANRVARRVEKDTLGLRDEIRVKQGNCSGREAMALARRAWHLAVQSHTLRV